MANDKAVKIGDVKPHMDEVVKLVNDIASRADDVGRRTIQDILMKLQHSFEQPYDTTMRMYDWHHRSMAARVGSDLEIFKALSESEKPLTVTDLVKRSGAAPQLLGRFLRYMASEDMIDEVDTDTFAANKTTKWFGTPAMDGGIHLSFDLCGRTYQELPDWFLERGYQDIKTNTDTPFQKAWNTNEPVFIWMRKQEKIFKHLHQALALQYRAQWLDSFPLEKFVGDFPEKAANDKDAVLFVDVGGSFGMQCENLRAKYPDMKGRVILQDLQETIDLVKQKGVPTGVEVLGHNFFEPQPIKGSKFYYYRNIFHDYPDVRVLDGLLPNLLPAMGSDSVLLIDDKVLPNKGVHRHAAMLDIAMVAQTGSLERTLSQWQTILGDGGCKILDIVTYTSEYDSILIVVPKDSKITF